MDPQARSTHIFTVLLIGLLWGLNWSAVKFMLTGIPPITIRAVAFTVAAVLLALYVRMKGHRLRPAAADLPLIAATGLLIIFGFNVSASLGQVLTDTSKAAIIAFTMPAFTAMFAAVFLGERLGARGFAALALGMAGLAVLASENINAQVAAPLGPAIMLAAAVSWALGTVLLKSRSWSLPPLALTVWFLAVSAAACWPLVLIFEPPWHQSIPSAPVLWTMGFHILGPMITCYALWTAMVGRISATISAIATLMVPVVGVISAVILLGDVLTWQKIVSLVMILSSIAMTQVPATTARCTK